MPRGCRGGGGFRGGSGGGKWFSWKSSSAASDKSLKKSGLSSSRRDDDREKNSSKPDVAVSGAPMQSQTGGWSSSRRDDDKEKKNSPKPVSSAPPPAPVQSQPVQGGIGSSFADGMAFGSGNAVGHRAVDAVLGPRVFKHEFSTTVADCGAQMQAFQECLRMNDIELSKCQFYIDMLCQCRGCPTISGLSA